MLDPIFVASLKVFTDFHANEFSSTSYDRNVFLAQKMTILLSANFNYF